MLIADWPGAEECRSIAVLAAGGQTPSLLLILLAILVLYSFCDGLIRIMNGVGGRRAKEVVPTAIAQPASDQGEVFIEVDVPTLPEVNR